MFVLESRWIDSQIAGHAPAARTLLDVGSESPEYRSTIQKHIAELYASLAARDIEITTLDSDPTYKPDIVQDITHPLVGSASYDVVLASNLLEHVEISRMGVAVANLFRLANLGGIAIVTVPFNLPEHGHPIDNMLLPTPEELVALVGHTVIQAGQWEEIHYKEPYLSNPSLSPAPIVTGAVFRQ